MTARALALASSTCIAWIFRFRFLEVLEVLEVLAARPSLPQSFLEVLEALEVLAARPSLPKHGCRTTSTRSPPPARRWRLRWT